jgi:hypothetical protein
MRINLNLQHATWFTQEHSYWFFITFQSHNDNDNKSSFERETNVDDGIRWYFDTYICSMCSNKLACVWSWTCDVYVAIPPPNITYAKNDNFKSS